MTKLSTRVNKSFCNKTFYFEIYLNNVHLISERPYSNLIVLEFIYFLNSYFVDFYVIFCCYFSYTWANQSYVSRELTAANPNLSTAQYEM